MATGPDDSSPTEASGAPAGTASHPRHGRALFGAATLAGASVFRLAVQFITLPVLARLLGPEAFGLVALAMPLVASLALLIESGLSGALVRVTSLSRELESTVFWVALTLSLALSSAIVLGADLIAAAVSEPAAAAVIAALAPTLVLSSLVTVPWARLQRDGRLWAIALGDLVGLSVGAAAAFYGAFHGWGVWSLVAQQVGFCLAKASVLFVVARMVPRLFCDPRLLAGIAAFSLGFAGSNVVVFLAQYTDIILVGAILGPAALGFYAVALQLVRIPELVLAAPAWQALFPAVAKAGEDRARAADIYLRSFRLVITVAAPMVIGITVIADLIVAVFLGPKWGPAATVIVALAPVGLLRCMAPLSSAMLSGTGRSGLQFWTSLLTVGLSAIGVAAGIALGGLPGAAAGLGVAMLGAHLPLHVLALREARLGAGVLLRLAWRPVLAAVTMGAAVIALRMLFLDGHVPQIPAMAIAGLTGCVVYGAVLLWLGERELLKELRRFRNGRVVLAPADPP